MIVPSIDFSQLSSIDQVIDDSLHWGLFGKICWRGDFQQHPEWVERALRKIAGRLDVWVEMPTFDEATAIELMNQGVTTVLVPQAVTSDIPEDRLMVVRQDDQPDEAIAAGLVLVADEPTSERLAELEMARVDCIVDSNKLTVELIVEFFEKVLQSDRPDGYWSTIIVDTMGLALGLAYSNRESLWHAIENRVGAYWSRSRDELWVKGETSGAVQQLLEIRMDCDRDCLRFKVVQDPPGFCHRLTHSCFGHERTIVSVVGRLASRIEDSDPKSFTKRLVSDPQMLESKLMEEAKELLEASQASDADAVAWEAADLFYFGLVAMLKNGVELSPVYNELARRMTRVVRRDPGIKTPSPNP